jgi:hypothetical protein
MMPEDRLLAGLLLMLCSINDSAANDSAKMKFGWLSVHIFFIAGVVQLMTASDFWVNNKIPA